MKMYKLEVVETLIARYVGKGGTVETIKEGTLGYGTTVLKAPRLKFAIIQEKYLNEWSSGHTVRFYSKMPAKYQQKAGA